MTSLASIYDSTALQARTQADVWMGLVLPQVKKRTRLAQNKPHISGIRTQQTKKCDVIVMAWSNLLEVNTQAEKAYINQLNHHIF